MQDASSSYILHASYIYPASGIHMHLHTYIHTYTYVHGRGVSRTRAWYMRIHVITPRLERSVTESIVLTEL